MGEFDQFANQGGPAAENPDALAKARRITDEQLRNADYSGDLPEPLGGGRHAADELTDAGSDGAVHGTTDDPTANDSGTVEAGESDD